MEIHFSKYQGAGNDFVLLDARKGLPCELTKDVVASLCDRRFGIGSDGLMTLENGGEGVDFRMRYFNSDGCQGTMCGNGGRCIVRLADDLGIGGAVKRFAAVDGIHRATIIDRDTIALQMIDIDGVERVGDDFFVQTGSPHYVILGDYDDVVARAKRDEHNANVNFVEILGDGALKVRTFERGVEAETWACGTGVTAAAAVVNFARQPNCQCFDIQALGGRLNVQFDGTQGQYQNVVLTGDAKKVFTGTTEI